jgi:glycine hydroxymethyltransferase
MTTRKTLRGPIGALIFSRREDTQTYHSRIGLNTKIDKAVFPGLQGGPMNHSIAGITQCLYEASLPEFKDYTQQIIRNAKRLSQRLSESGFRVVSGDTQKHLVLIDLSDKNIKGKNFALALEKVNIIVNANTHPREQGSPFNPTGIRLGTPAITSREMVESDIDQIVSWINQTYNIVKDAPEKLDEFNQFINGNTDLSKIATEVEVFASKFPVPGLDN